MKAQKHTLLNKKDEHGGLWDRTLFSALKEHADKPEIKRVEKVLSLLVAADTHAREQLSFWRRSENKDWGKGGVPVFIRQSLSAYHSTLELLNAALRRYRWGAQVIGGTGGFLTRLHPATTAKNRWVFWESVTVGMLLDLTSKPGELSRFRRCSECQQWFYAVRGHQQFCGGVCRRRHAAQNPEFKEKRKTYMRERYRPLQKELEQHSLATLKNTSQKNTKG